MTNHWIDIGNSDCIMAIGSNPAENHPASFGWVQEAIDKGAKLISVDPRFTRTSSRAHIYAPIRSGTDIAFIGGMIRYVLEDMRINPANYNTQYVCEYTNAALIINSGYQGPPDLDGKFIGYDSTNRKYSDKSKWQYANTTAPTVEAKLTANNCDWSGWTEWTDLNQYCVLRLLWDHFSRYTMEKVSQITGCPEDILLEVYKTYAATGQTGKAGTICYAMGTTQHTYGTQNIRTYAILQLLLGNIGVSGGGINAMRGEANVQGSTDHCLLWHILPGYLGVPTDADTNLAAYLTRVTPSTVTPNGLTGDKSANWWSNYQKYIVSLLKAWYGTNATSGNDFMFSALPKVKTGVDYSWISLFEAMYAGTIKGAMVWGQNPAVCGPNSNRERAALENLEWLVVVDIWETETAAFWKRPGANSSAINTEVWLLPAAFSYEKQGSVTNSGRWAQWRYKCVNPPGDARADLDMLNDLGLKLQELYGADATAPNRNAIVNLTWGYATAGYGGEADAETVAKEINGYAVQGFTTGTTTYVAGDLLNSFGHLQTDGSTSSGNWLYCASFTNSGNMIKRRDTTPDYFNTGLYPNWGWAWPVNRRIIYNRASVDLDGVPWDKEHPVIWYINGSWEGDVADGGWAPINAAAAGSKYLPFIMKPEGVGRIFGMGRADGPLPEHYEPWESPIENPMSGTQIDPAGMIWETDGPDYDRDARRVLYPIVCSTYRITEHWQSGQLTRNIPFLVELQPEMFVEMSEELADEKGIRNGDKVKVKTARGEVEGVAVVTKRFRPFQLNGTKVHQIGMPWHWGYQGISTGDSANLLTPHVGDANTGIPEYKAFLCNIEKA